MKAVYTERQIMAELGDVEEILDFLEMAEVCTTEELVDLLDGQLAEYNSEVS